MLQRIYCPRHLLPGKKAQAGASEERLLVGWRNQQQICIATAISSDECQGATLAEKLAGLRSHAELQALWTHTNGPPQILGVLSPATTPSATNQQPEDGELHLRIDSATGLPVVLSSPHPASSASAAQPSSPCQVILFDAPEGAKYFDLQSPFRDADVREEGADGCARPRNDQSASSDTEEATEEEERPSSTLQLALRQINSARVTEKILRHFLTRPLDASTEVARSLSPPSRGAGVKAAIGKAFSPLVSPFLCVVSALLRLLHLPSFSVTHLFTSFFTPPFDRRVIWKRQPVWRGAHTLAVIKEKLDLVDKMREIKRVQALTDARLFGVVTSASTRLSERSYTLYLTHLVEVRLAVLVTLVLLHALGTLEPLLAHLPFGLGQRITPPSLERYVDGAWLLSGVAHVRDAFEWLLSSDAPAGLKLNPRLHAALGNLARHVLMEQAALVRSVWAAILHTPVVLASLRLLAHAFLVLLCCFGVRLLLALALDLIWFFSLPFQLVAGVSTRCYSFVLRAFSSLVLLFRGKKRNVLRKGRVDTFAGGSFEHTILGTLGLVILTLLGPTCAVWYGIGVVANLLACHLPTLLLSLASGALQHLPITPIVWWTRDRLAKDTAGQRVPAGVWMEVVDAHPASAPAAAATTYLQLHSAASSFPSLLFRYRGALQRALHSHPPSAILSKLIFGSPTAVPAASAAK